MFYVSGPSRPRCAFALLTGIAICLLAPSGASAGNPGWKLIYCRQIGKTVNANNRTIENFLFRANGTKGSGVGLTNLSNSGFAIFGNADMNGYVRINTDLNNFYYDVRVYQLGVATDQGPNFYYQNQPAGKFYSFETHWLYVPDDAEVTTFPFTPVYHYDLVNGLNTAALQEPPGYDNTDDFGLDLGGPTSAAYHAQTFVVPPGINRIISAKAFATKELGVHFQYRATIHRGGPTGEQIGPAVVSRDIASPDFLPISVNWSIDDVPVIPGETCALKVAPVSGGTFNAFATKTNNYANGIMYNGANANPTHDLLAVVVGIGYNPLPPAVIELSPTSIVRSVARGSNRAAEQFTVRNAGGDPLNYSISDDMNWLSVDPTTGTSTGETDAINVSYTTAGLALGQYTGTITVAAAGATNSPQTIPVTLDVLPPAFAPCDFDTDTDVDMEDFGRFQACFSGPGFQQPDANCSGAKLDGDSDVDKDDLTRFRQCLLGAGVPVSPTCAD